MKRSLRIVTAIATLLTGLGTAEAQVNDNMDYYWFQNSGDWNDLNKWRVASLTAPGTFETPVELPDATNRVFINGPAAPLSISQNTSITVGTAGTPHVGYPASAAAKSISFLGATNRTVSFTVNQPLTIDGDLTTDFRIGITANNTMTIKGSLTINALATSTSFAVNQPVFIDGAVTMSAASASIAVNRPLTIKGAVTISNTGSITADNPLSIGGTLKMSNTNGRFNINAAVKLGGSLDLAAAANVTGTTGSVTFASTAPAIIKAPATATGITFNVPVTFDGVNGTWTLHTNVTVNKQVTFTNGYVNAPAYDATTAANSRMLIFADVAPAPLGASNNSHVIGYVQKLNLAANTPLTMPTGAGSGLYRPIIAENTSENNVVAKYFNASPNSNPSPVLNTSNILPIGNGNPTPQLASVSNREYWYITSNATSGFKVHLNYNRADAENYYFINDPWRRTMLTVAGWKKNGGWSDINLDKSTTLDLATTTIKSAGSLNQVEYFTIGTRGASPLPVRLVSFTGKQLDNQVHLKWQSSSEENTSHFEVEKSADGKNFTQVLTKKAQGNSTALVSYTAIDNNPMSGTSYYRLKMVDLDGTFEYSKLVAVSAEGTLAVRAYPNPSKGSGISLVAGDGSKLVLKSVSDLFGKQVGYQAGNAAGESLQINFAQPLPAGFYVATLAGSDNGQLVKVKFVVQ